MARGRRDVEGMVGNTCRMTRLLGCMLCTAMKTKRTYNISTEVVATVKRLVEEQHVAPSQDALVEQAIVELARQLRDAADARRWQQAATDAEFQTEVAALDEEFAADDLDAWKP